MQADRKEDAAEQFQDLKRIRGKLSVIRSPSGEQFVIAPSARAIMHVALANPAGI